jgi:hypothetical protein
VKRCSKCGVLKDQAFFTGVLRTCDECRRRQKKYRDSNRSKLREYGRQHWSANKDRLRKQRAQTHAANPERKRAYSRKYNNEHKVEIEVRRRTRKYGLTPAGFDLLKKSQGNRCAICWRDAILMPDHCHFSGKVRGLLCKRCNTGLGQFKDNADLVQRAAKYLLKEIDHADA